ncbi:MAG: serine/threonine protein kinase [Planctomycetales bacterium]|nr:serine/threonine protein kinase [Planctomycetales bacterium]
MSSGPPFDPYHRWLGIRATNQPVNHYRLLGLDVFEEDLEVIASAADRQMAHVRSFQNGPQGEASQALLAKIAVARLCLIDSERKANYDDQLARELLQSGEGPSSDGAAFGEYLLLDQLAVASASCVFHARHRTMQRDVALQTLNSRAAASAHEVNRFRRKAAILARLEHPHLISIYDAGIRDGVHCLVMELVRGESLHALLAGPRDSQETVRMIVEWTKQAAAGLGHAHSRGVIHRRVSPSNLLLDSRQGVKVAGFGLALVDELPGPVEAQWLALQRAPETSGTRVGNIDYVAPEQLDDSQGVDVRADIYGLGCTLSALLRRRPPFTGAAPDKIHQHQFAAPPRLTNIPGVDADLERIVHGMMAKSPAERQQSMYEVIQSLQGWLLKPAVPPPAQKPVPVVIDVRPRGR